MSFEKIENLNLENKHNRSCMMVVNFDKKELITIKNIGGMLGIRDQITLDNKNGESIVKNILDGDISSDCENGIKNKSIIFNNIPNNKINAFLESLKKMKIRRPLTAMVTDTSIGWTLNKLIVNLEEERQAMKSGKYINHK